MAVASPPIQPPKPERPVVANPVSLSAARQTAFEMFREGKSRDEVCTAVSRAPATVAEYLVEFIHETEISDPMPWVDQATFERVRQAQAASTDGRLKPLFEALGGDVTYDTIRIAMACLRHEPPDTAAPSASVEEFREG